LHRRPDVDARRIGGPGPSLRGGVMFQNPGGTGGLNCVVSGGAGIPSIREEMLKAGAAHWLAPPLWGTPTAPPSPFSDPPPPRHPQSPGPPPPAPPPSPHHPGPPRRGEKPQQAFLEGARPPKGAWKAPRPPPHGRPRDSPAGIRAPRRRLLRRRPSGPAPSGQMIGRCRPGSCFRIEVVTERRPTFRVVAAAPSPLGVGRTAALAGLLLGAACVLALSVAGLPSRVGPPPAGPPVGGGVGLVVVAIVSMVFVVSLGMMASARARARRARHRVPGVRLPLLQRPLLVALLAA